MSPEEREAHGICNLPGPLHNAVTEMMQDGLVCEMLGEHIVGQYVIGKMLEWDTFRTHVSQ